MKSPLLGLAKTLRFYSFIGVFPARLDEEAERVTPELWRYLPQVAVAMTYSISMAVMHKWSTSEECLFPNLTWDRYWKKLSAMGRCGRLIPCLCSDKLYVCRPDITFQMWLSPLPPWSS